MKIIGDFESLADIFEIEIRIKIIGNRNNKQRDIVLQKECEKTKYILFLSVQLSGRNFREPKCATVDVFSNSTC